MIQTPDPFFQDDPETPELLDLEAQFPAPVIEQLRRDTFNVYGGWALTCWGFPFRLYSEKTRELPPSDDTFRSVTSGLYEGTLADARPTSLASRVRALATREMPPPDFVRVLEREVECPDCMIAWGQYDDEPAVCPVCGKEIR